MDLSKIVFTVTLSLVTLTQVFAQEPTECDRGVRRHHPSQANVYQVFTRKDFRKQWINYSCPEYKVFDPRTCECVPGQHVGLPPARDQRSNRLSTPRSASEMEQERSRGNRRAPSQKLRQSLSEDRHGSHEGRHDARGSDVHPRDRVHRHSSRDQTLSARRADQQSASSKDREERTLTKEAKSDKEPNCQLHRRTENPAMYERWSDGKWVEEDCNWPFYTGLVWSQDACRCEWGPNRTSAVPLMENGVPATCLMMLKVTFDNGEIRDEGRHIWLNVKGKEGAMVEEDKSAAGGYAGHFRGSSIMVPYFKSNVLGDIFHVGFSFKLCPGDPDTDIVLLHNDCPESDAGASLVISYQAWNRRLTVALRTINTDELQEDSCTLASPPNQWTKIDLRYADSLLDVFVNDKMCAQSDKHYGPVATNNCPFTLLGEAFCGSLDEVIITRGCTEAHAIS